MIDELRARAAGLTRGLEAELALAVDVMFPTERLVEMLEGFAAAFPTVALRLRVEALGGVSQLVLDGVAALGSAGGWASRFETLERREIGEVELVPVAAPSHPLARGEGPLSAAALRDHTQLVLTDRSAAHRGPGFRRGFVADLAARRSRREAHAAARRPGLGPHAGASGARGSRDGPAGPAYG